MRSVLEIVGIFKLYKKIRKSFEMMVLLLMVITVAEVAIVWTFTLWVSGDEIFLSLSLPIRENDKFYLQNDRTFTKLLMYNPSLIFINFNLKCCYCWTWNLVSFLMCWDVFLFFSTSNLNLHFRLKHQFDSSGLLLSFWVHWNYFFSEQKSERLLKKRFQLMSPSYH